MLVVQAGFQTSGCVHRLWDDTVEEYIAFLVEHQFNSVRLPLSVQWILTNGKTTGVCGEYEGWATLDILDDVVIRLEQAGIFVVLDMHTLESDGNQGLWCYANSLGECTTDEEAPIREAWEVLAARYCSSPNVVGADLFNEPFSATWGLGSSGTDWGLAAGRLGSHVLSRCSRWLILVEGVASNNGQCRASASHDSCWWGENLIPQTAHPVQLSDPSKLVLSPHVYGHGTQDYMYATDFPDNMPTVWDAHWGHVPDATGTPIIVGEWGGVWEDTVFGNRFIPSTKIWQQMLQDYLKENSIGFFYWTLNDNSFKTGSLFNEVNEPKWLMLGDSPVTIIDDLQEALAPTSPQPPPTILWPWVPPPGHPPNPPTTVTTSASTRTETFPTFARLTTHISPTARPTCSSTATASFTSGVAPNAASYSSIHPSIRTSAVPISTHPATSPPGSSASTAAAFSPFATTTPATTTLTTAPLAVSTATLARAAASLALTTASLASTATKSALGASIPTSGSTAV